MHNIDLDFAQRPGLHRGVAAGLLALGLLALLAAGLRVATLQTQIGHLAAEIDDAQRANRHERRPLQPTSAADKEATARELARANQVVASLNLGWSGLFKRLESIQLPGVTLLAVQPESGTARRLRLSGEARRLEDALAYVKQLASTPGLRNAHLVSHEVLQDGGRPTLRFVLVADWAGQP